MALTPTALPSYTHFRRTINIASAVCNKHGHRLLSSLQAVSDDSTAVDRLIRKFVASSSKSTSMQTLTHLLSCPSFAVPMYRRICEASWFRFQPNLAATIAALLEKSGDLSAAETLISDSVSRMEGTRDLTVFYCALIESCSKHGLKRRVFDSVAILTVSSPPVGRRAYESMVKAFCWLELPREAEKKAAEMVAKGFRPSAFEFRSMAQAYGRSKDLENMKRIVEDMEKAGYPVETVCANVVLSCYGDHGELSEMVAWMKKMRSTGVPFSIRTFNSVLNSCPGMVSMVRDLESLPLSIGAVTQRLDCSYEAALVQELSNGGEVLSEVVPSDWTLDLHGCHLGSAYLILLMWVEALRARLVAVGEKNAAPPVEVSIVCGSGKHSGAIGESPVKRMVSRMMVRMGSPMRMDRKNRGRFIAKGKTVREWLCSNRS